MVVAVTVLSSCSESFLENDSRSTFSKQQLDDLANSDPELILSLAGGFESGNNFFLNDFNTGDNGGLHDDFGQMAINLGTDLMSNDAVQVTSHWFVNYYNYTARIETSNRTDMIWGFYYKVINTMNQALVLFPDEVENPQLRYTKGRLLAMRGFAYFNLIRIYGNGDLGVPLYTDKVVEQSRQPVEDIKAQIISDLEEAYDLLDGYVRNDKVTLDKSVVAGLLARYSLEYGNYAQAATYAAEARANVTPMGSDQLFDGFNKITNSEWMWGADITSLTSTIYASFFSHMGNLNNGYAGQLQVYKSVDKRIFDRISATDARRAWFVDDGNPFGLPKYANIKFVDDTNFEGDYVFMRAAEMYLIEAEAKALAGDEAGAKQVLFDLVSTRDAGYTLSANSGPALLDEIRFHRKLELWGEGFAFFDMKRWNTGLNRTYDGSNHATFGKFDYPAGSAKFVFQIPQAEINANTELGAQNPL